MKIPVNNVFEQNEKPYDRDPSKNTFAQFIVRSGLYEKYEVTKENIQDIIDVLNGHVRINIFCKECDEKRIFSLKKVMFPFQISEGSYELRSLGSELSSHQSIQEMCNMPRPGDKFEEKEWYWTNWQTEDYTHVMVFKYQCALDSQHFTDYIIRTDGNLLTKIGQFPSVADLSFPELEKYNKVLSKEDRKEFGRAIGLFASGIGIGAYVYLRRIFERMLEIAKNNAIQDGCDLQDYDKSHVTERIKMLKDYLPKTLVENANFYGIVSKGIHELSEDECVTYFPVLRDFLFLILSQWEQQRQQKETESQLAASLSQIAQKIK